MKMSSNIATANLIGSVPQDLEQPIWNKESTPQSIPWSTQGEELTVITRRQVQVLRNQDSLSRKLDHVISLLSMPVANQNPVIQVPHAVRSQVNPQPSANPQPVTCTMPPAPSPPEQSANRPGNVPSEPFIPVHQVPHKELFQIKNMSRSIQSKLCSSSPKNNGSSNPVN